jgi:NADH:ubiquinone oxidoreductase subunit 4 (subunit M)
MFGPVTHAENEGLRDLTWRERLVFAPIILLIFWMGVMPQPFLDRMQPALDRMLDLSRERARVTRMLDAPSAPVADRGPVPGEVRP